MKKTSVWMRALAILACGVMLLGMLTACGDSKPDKGDGPSDNDKPSIKGTAVTLTDDELYDKVAGSWIGQMVGVTWSASTEFLFNGVIIPEGKVPTWTPEMVNDAFAQDDLYVEVPFIDAMTEHGPSATIDQIAPYFRDSKFGLAHANYQGRLNLQNGIDPSLAGHYKYNYHADDIDWQIEADFLGNIFPGMVSYSAERAFEIGHLVNYGDGVYGGVFVSAMHAMAMVSDDLNEVIQAGVTAVPEGTKFRKVCDQVLACHKEGMTWQECWQDIEKDWANDDKCPEGPGAFNIDAKINAAYILIGLLWGEGDFADTIVISMRCGQDSDCNPSSAAAILGTMYGLKGIPEEYKSAVNYDRAMFHYTTCTLNDCIKMNTDLAKRALKEQGATYESGTWTLVKEEGVIPVPVEQWPDDELVIYLNATPRAAGEVGIKVTCVLPVGEVSSDVSYTFDMGDGTILPVPLSSYFYSEPGEYTIKCTASVGEHSATAETKVDVTTQRHPGFKTTASCSQMAPLGGGSRDISIIADGEIPIPVGAALTEQYDTFSSSPAAEEWFALDFDHVVTVSKVYFTEGAHFENGGWFKKTPRIEVLVDGKWTAVDTTCSPLYIEVDGMTAQGEPYQTFIFALEKETACEGIRVIGAPGGTGRFASCSELSVLHTDVVDPTYDLVAEDVEEESTLILSVASPGGAGCKDANIIRDGKLPPVGSSGNHDTVQYDSFTGSAVDHEEFYGYVFRHEWKVTSVIFTEGAHFHDGGWFKNGAPRLELLVDGEWVEATAAVTPKYPVGDSVSVFGNSYESYTFSLSSPATCRGIRIIGMAGGAGHFTSISELSVEVER